MAECKNGTSNSRTFFGELKTFYPEIIEEDKIKTETFLQASRGIVSFFDLLGAIFSPVKSDINGNIQKLQKKYDTDPIRFDFLLDMLQSELDDKVAHVAIESLLWLKRALEFAYIFLKQIIDDYSNGNKQEDLVPFCRQAYEQTLMRYHGWFVQKIFKFCVRGVPWRKDLMKALALDQINVEEIVIHEMTGFVQSLSTNLNIIIHYYQINNLDSDAKV